MACTWYDVPRVCRSITDAVNRLAHRKQAPQALTSEQRELMEIERCRAAAVRERAKSREYWEKTKHAGGKPKTPTRNTFLRKCGHVAAAADRPIDDGAPRSGTGSSQGSKNVRKMCEPVPSSRRDMVSNGARTPVSTVLSPFGTVTPPMQATGAARFADGGSATFAGFLGVNHTQSSDDGGGAMKAKHVSTPVNLAAGLLGGVMPKTPATQQTPLMWEGNGGQHARASVDAIAVGDAEVHLEVTKGQVIRLSLRPDMRRGSDASDDVSASLTPRVPASFVQSRASALGGLSQGPLFPVLNVESSAATVDGGPVAEVEKVGGDGVCERQVEPLQRALRSTSAAQVCAN